MVNRKVLSDCHFKHSVCIRKKATEVHSAIAKELAKSKGESNERHLRVHRKQHNSMNGPACLCPFNGPRRARRLPAETLKDNRLQVEAQSESTGLWLKAAGYIPYLSTDCQS